MQERNRRAIALDDAAMALPAAEIAAAVTTISVGVAALRTKLTDRAVLALLVDSTGLSKKTIKQVLDAMGDLKKNYAR